MKTSPVMQELRQVLTEARKPPGRDQTATYSQVAGSLKAVENVVRKFERGESAPNFNRIDDLVAAYSDATGISVFDLWDEAIKRAKKGGVARPTDNPSTVAAAAGEKLRGKTSPKGRRRTGN